MIIEHAPAKINLALHVTGQRQDGYHELSSLVAFADYGDVLTLLQSRDDRFHIEGEFAPDLGEDADNLVNRARALLENLPEARNGRRQTLAITLEKNLPVASGIGGGSADAAASLRALNKIWGLNLGLPRLQKLSRELGADLSMCVTSRAALVSGIGNDIEPVAPFPALPAVLVNPLIEVPTPAVFKELTTKTNAPMPSLPRNGLMLSALIDYLVECRNDLEAPARRVAPAIDDVLMALRGDRNCLLARMSGSGATCFALFATDDQATMAGKALADTRPDWWIRVCRIKDDPFGFTEASCGQ